MSIQKLMESLSHQTIPDSTLYVIGTPIGNMGDISLRALHILGLVDAVACEDTRVTRNLLSFYGLSKELISAHQHNEREIAAKLVDRLRNGDRIALVSDAGTPAVSDPGAKIVDTVRQSGLNVIPIPGPSAAITALSASGFPDKHFLFVGFLPTRAVQRREFLLNLKNHYLNISKNALSTASGKPSKRWPMFSNPPDKFSLHAKSQNCLRKFTDVPSLNPQPGWNKIRTIKKANSFCS